MEHEPSDETFTVETARRAARDDELGDWVRRFLASPGSDNAVLGEQLSDPPRVWVGPVEVPIDRLHRLAGPPGSPAIEEVPEGFWRDDVQDLAEKVDDGLEPAPVIATFKGDHLMLEDGNHRVEALRRAGCDRAWTIIAFADQDIRDRFLDDLGR